MKIVMVGEAANHQSRLSARLPAGMEFLALPRDAAASEAWDGAIDADDVLITLRFSRPAGRSPAVRLLHVPGAGLDGIALDALHPATTVCNVYEHEIAIAEYVLLALLDHEIRLADMRARFAALPWADAYRGRVPHGEVHGKRLGLIGLGRIARAIAARAQAFGMRVAASDVAGAAIPGLVDEFLPAGRLDELLAQSDYVVVACPLTAATRGMLGARQLAAMKPTAVVVNVSRAEIIDEAALFQALERKAIGAAVLDVWYRYPAGDADDAAPSRYPFHTLDNAVCTPHSCAWTGQLPERRYAFVARNIERLLAGEPLQNVVRAPARPRPAP